MENQTMTSDPQSTPAKIMSVDKSEKARIIHIKRIQSRIEFLKKRIETPPFDKRGFDRAECSSLEWALTEVLALYPELEPKFPDIQKADLVTET